MQPITSIPNGEPLAASYPGCPIRPPLVAPPFVLGVDAADLRYCNQYREGDYIAYGGWLGRVLAVYEKVKIRLVDNRIASVKDPKKLKEPDPSFISSANESHQSLVNAGYTKIPYPPDLREDSMTNSCLRSPCFPGLVVQTDEENIFSSQQGTSEDGPSRIVIGTVVEAWWKALNISWVAFNPFNEGRALKRAPPCLLDRRTLHRRLGRLYDRDRRHENSDWYTLALSLNMEDFALGQFVRFQNPSAAALAYDGTHAWPDGTPKGKFIPVRRSRTGGYDLNVLRIVGLRRYLLIQWQDATCSQELASSVSAYMTTPGDDNVYPGEIVRLEADAARRQNLGKQDLGLVQWVNPQTKLAQVAWFHRQEATYSVDDHSAKVITFATGRVREIHTPLSYLSTPTTLHLSDMRLGDFAIIIPCKIPPLHSMLVPWQTPQHQAYIQIIFFLYGSQPTRLRPVLPTERIDRFGQSFGQIVGLYSYHGYAMLRFGALPEVEYRYVPIERVMVLAREPGKPGSGWGLLRAGMGLVSNDTV